MTAARSERPPPAVPVLTLVDPLVPDDDLSIEDLGSRIVGLAGRLAAITCQWLLLVASFDAQEGFQRFGLGSTARWLTHCCGLSHRAAVDHVRVARALRAFPQLAEALSTARISYSHARAITRLAKEGEQRTVEDLIDIAQSGTVGQLETIVRGLRTVEHLEDGATEPAEEYVRTGWSQESQWRLGARLAPERGAVVQRAIEAMWAAEGLSPAEALERIAEVALAVLARAGLAPELRADERAAVVVSLDLASARRVAPPPDAADRAPTGTGSTEEQQPSPPTSAPPTQPSTPQLRGHIVDGPGLPTGVLERLLCGSRLRTNLYRADGTLFDLGRSRRVVSERLLRALLDRDGGCTHPGCESRAGLEAHHVVHWLHGGRTDLANLVLLCRRHHHAHHDDEFSIGRGPGRTFVFRRADGRVLEEHVDPARLVSSVAAPVAAEPAAERVPRWTGTGQRLDRDWAVAILAHRRHGVPPQDAVAA